MKKTANRFLNIAILTIFLTQNLFAEISYLTNCILNSAYLNLNSNEFPLHALRVIHGENSICNFDILGNRKTVTVQDGVSVISEEKYNTTAGTYYADETNKINKIETTNNTNYTNELTHDLNGNITDDGKSVYIFDVENKLLSATNKTTSAKKEYFYDAESRLIKSLHGSSGQSSVFLYNGSQIVEERNSAGALLQWNIHGLGIDDLLRTTKTGIKYYPLTNEQNSVLAVTDIAGNVLQRYDYSSFGKLTVQDADGTVIPNGTEESIPLISTLFQGRELDLETGLYNFRARWYSAELGRFISHDPIEYADGMNMYEGFRGNPVRYTDPMGEFAVVDDLLLIGIAAAGVALSDPEVREKGAELLSDAADWVQGSCENIGKKIGEAVYGAAEKEVEQETSKPSEEQHQKEQKQQNENIKNTTEGAGGVTTPPPPPNPEEGQEKDSKSEKNKTSSEEITKQTEKEADGKKNTQEQTKNQEQPSSKSYYPPNRGFSETPKSTTLQPGTIIDRYGEPTGSFASPQGTPPEARSLPDGVVQKPLNTYEVIKPFEVDSGEVAPWFNQSGGGIQYDLRNTVQDLLDKEYLRPKGGK